MPLNKKHEEFLVQIDKAGNKPFHLMTISEMREATKNFKVFQGHPEDVFLFKKEKISTANREIELRIYRPSRQKKLPVVLYFHSGGYVKGDVEYCDSFCRRVANGSQIVVISVNYRLAPESKFPSALEDAYEALLFVKNENEYLDIDANKIGVMGESSGGNLAASVCLLSYLKKGPSIKFQLLIYPQLDYTMSFSSYEKYKEGFFLTKEALEFYSSQYFEPTVDRKDELVSPLWTKNYKNLPPAYVITAEYDPLQQEGEAFAKNLSIAGVRAVHRCYSGMVHGFVSMPTLLEEASEACLGICEALKIGLNKKISL
jgi:acetyl esterase